MYQPIQWARQTADGRQDASDGSRLLDFYAERAVAPDESKVPVLLRSTPGTKPWVKATQGDRPTGVGPADAPASGIFGMVAVETPETSQLIAISGGYTLIEIRTKYLVGTVPNSDLPDDYDPFADGAQVHSVDAGRKHEITAEKDQFIRGPIRMVTDGERVLWVQGRRVWAWSTKSEDFDTVLAPTPTNKQRGLPDDEWVDCDWVDGYFVLGAANGEFWFSELNSVQFKQTTFSKASYKPDGLVAVRVIKRVLFLFGTRTIERWNHIPVIVYDEDGNPEVDFPFQRDTSGSIDIGCLANATVQAHEEHIFFLGSDKSVYAIQPTGLARISTEPLETLIARSDTSKARAFVYTEEGHRFYSLTLYIPDGTDKGWKNWTFDVNTALWHERSMTNVFSAARFGGQQLIGRSGGSRDPSTIYDLRLDWGDDSGTAIEREAISPVIWANQQRMECHYLELDIPSKKGAETDTIALTWSDERKKPDSWKGGNLAPRKLDAPRIKWNNLGQFRSRNFRVKTNAKRRVTVLGAYTRATVYSD